MASAMSLALTPAPATPWKLTRMRAGLRASRVCVASTCSTSEVPMPWAMVASAPCVLVWLSPQTITLGGNDAPCSGPDTCTMPCLGSDNRNNGTANSAQFRSSASICARARASSRCAARSFVGTLWSGMARLASLRHGLRPASCRPPNPPPPPPCSPQILSNRVPCFILNLLFVEGWRPSPVRGPVHASIVQSSLCEPVEADRCRLLQHLRLSEEVVRRPLKHRHGLVGRARSLEYLAHMGLWHGVIGTVLDGQERNSERLRTGYAICVAVIRRPLGQPGAQRGKARNAHGAVVHRFGNTHEAPPDRTIIGLDGRVEKAWIRHGSMGNKPALYLLATFATECFQGFLDPRGASAQPCSLARTERGEEVGAVWRTACRRIQVQPRVNAIRIVLIQHRRVDPFREHPGPSRMCCLENEGIGGHQAGLLDTAGVSSGRGGYCWIFSLRLVQQ